MSSTPPMTLSQALPVVPDLGIATAYENWRNESLKIQGVSRKTLADYLIGTNSEIGLLRATLILGVEAEHFEIAYQLAGQLLCAEDKIIQLYGRYQMAFLTISRGFSSDSQAPITAQTALPTLSNLLVQLEALPRRTALAIELELRIYRALTEGYLVIEDYELAHSYASRMAMLAPIVGLKTAIYSARSLVAMCLQCLGKTKSAIAVMREQQQDKNNHPYHFYIASNLAEALFFEGDFTSVLQLTSEQTEATSELKAHLQAFRMFTLLVPNEPIQLELVGNRSAAFARACQHLLVAFGSNLQSEERQIAFRKARLASSESVYNPNTWRAGFEGIFNAICSTRAGDYGLVSAHLPTLSQLNNYPLWARILGFATGIEVILRTHSKARQKTELSEITFELQKVLNDLEIHLLDQITKALQLYTPFALAWISTLGNVQEIVAAAGRETILNLNSRPIRVYSKAGLRPLQAAEFTLTSFGIPIFPNRMGGGQLEVFTACLQHLYGENSFWFEPVPPARLIVVLLETAELDPRHRESLRIAAQQVYRTFGLLPQLQQTNQISALIALEVIILKVLFGTASIKDVWHVVEAHGGHI